MQLHNSVWTGAMNRSPTPTECTLQLFMCNQCLHHVHVIFTHIHQGLHPRTPTVGSRFIVPAYYGMYGVDNRVQPMFYPRTPTVIRGCNLHNSVWTGAINRSPTPTECTLQLFMYNQCLHHVHVIFTHVHQCLHPRAPTVGSRFIVPAYHGMYGVDCPRTPRFICERPIY